MASWRNCKTWFCCSNFVWNKDKSNFAVLLLPLREPLDNWAFNKLLPASKELMRVCAVSIFWVIFQILVREISHPKNVSYSSWLKLSNASFAFLMLSKAVFLFEMRSFNSLFTCSAVALRLSRFLILLIAYWSIW